MKKAAGILMTAVGAVLCFLSALLAVHQIIKWMEWGFCKSELRFFFIIFIFMILMALLCIMGIQFMRRKNRTAGERENFEGSAGTERWSEDLDTKVYKSAPRLLLTEFIKKLILIGFLLFLLFYVLLDGLKYLAIAKGVCTGIWLTCTLVLSAFWAFYWCRIRIEVSASGLKFCRGSRRYAEYPLNTGFWAVTEKKRLNGIFTGTNRLIFVPVRPHYNKVLNCYGIQALDFSNLMEDINKLRKDGTFEKIREELTAEHIYETCDKREFQIPREKLLKRERRRAAQIGIGCAAAGAISAALWFCFLHKKPLDTEAVFLMLIIFLLISVPVPVLQIFRCLAYAGKVPERIVLADSSLRVDEISYPVREIKRISMTPVNFGWSKNGTSFRRRMVVLLETKREEYQLGSTASAGVPKELVLKEYGEMVTSLRQWCAGCGILFQEDRE
ncbi:hypothetical protein LQE92_03125 [Lacrimispora sp. NSJ-141]|uniref:Uncharacterized protein n=1 Tax=Lientehia hominis TaxID=2897778 RepID=A0AAP2RGM5_9FIRM|nr:hypothetical protein [Lientehia hominis]MCD2491617.1 hypothetical protein [Lientehia hominis]